MLRPLSIPPTLQRGWRLSVLALLLARVALAQSTATLTGTLLDPSGAVVPNVEVTCHNVQTGVAHRAVTSAQGLFRFPNLPIGEYELVVEHPGFERLVRSGLQMLTGRTDDVTLQLQLGQSRESVEVTAGAPLVQTTSSEVQTTFNSKNTSELPLNGRNPLQLVVLTPGARLSNVGTQGDQQENPGVTTNGLRSIDNNYELDGTIYLNRFADSAPVLPNPDALQEFTVKASNYGASESGAGASVQLSTRAGSNELHGSGYEFLRNDAFDARNFFAAVVTPFGRNQYGATTGGPLKRDQAFFFGSYQGTRISGGVNPRLATVPTAAMRGGDFSGTAKIIIDPLTGQPFPSNRIPSERFDPLAVKLLPYVPLPNVSNQMVAETPNTDTHDEQFLTRVDHSMTAMSRLTARYTFDEYDYNRLTSAFHNIYARNFFRTQNALISDTHTFSPSLLFMFTFGFARTARTQIPTAPTTLQALGQNVPEAIANADPELRVNVNGYYNLFSGGGLGYQGNISHYRARFTWSHERHLVQFGLDVERDHLYSYDTSFASGTTTFNGSRTSSVGVRNSGDAFADFLLGLPNRFSQGARTPQDFSETKWQPWIEDDWRVSPRVTLNLGLRWEPWLPPVNALAPGSAFIPGVQSQVAPFAPRGLLFYPDPGLQQSIFPKDWHNFAPRLGLAWDVTGSGKNVIRGAYGIFYRSIPLNMVRTSYSGSAFTSLSVDITNPPSFQDPYRGFSGGIPFPFNPPPLGALSTYRFVSPVVTSVLDPAARTGYTQQWHMTVERQIGRDLALSVAYVGNHSIRILATYQANPAVPGPGATTSNTDTRRLYPGLGPLAIASPWGFEKYDGLQAQATKRLGAGLSVLANYVWSRCMDNTTAQVQGADAGGGNQIHKFDLNLDYGPCDFDAAHVANVSVVYDLPRLESRHGLAGRVLNGWTVSGIFAARSGLPFTIFSGRDNSLTGQPNNDLADQVLPDASRPAGADPLRQWFNPAAFNVNAIETFGNTSRNGMRGPGSWDLDAGVFKRTRITERVVLQFRFEAFNLFNHPNFGNPVSTVTNPNFARITTASDPRVLQFAAKLIF